jgi:hypothetical protein
MLVIRAYRILDKLALSISESFINDVEQPQTMQLASGLLELGEEASPSLGSTLEAVGLWLLDEAYCSESDALWSLKLA